jgi:uncharacterized protein YbjT (DUF2867 family)
MIIITGGTGQLGRAIVESLARRVPPSRIGVSVRDPEKAAALSALGARVRQGDYARPDGLAHAFEGATQVLIVSSNAAAFGGDPLAQHRAAIGAARAAGARRVLYTSHMAASASSAFAPARDHAATEDMLRASGLAWTALRNGFYASSGVAMMRDAFQTGVLDVPTDGKVSWTAHADLADAAAAILADEGRYDGATPPLVGADSLDLAGLAEVASGILGRPIRRQLCSDDDLRARIVARGAPPAVVEIALGFYSASRSGEFAAADGTMEQLIGRRPTPIRDVVAPMVRGQGA